MQNSAEEGRRCRSTPESQRRLPSFSAAAARSFPRFQPSDTRGAASPLIPKKDIRLPSPTALIDLSFSLLSDSKNRRLVPAVYQMQVTKLFSLSLSLLYGSLPLSLCMSRLLTILGREQCVLRVGFPSLRTLARTAIRAIRN